ncbi:helix-turn-helix domain-containing protein [Actinoplanes sp. DH11]|uniref:helix-turn-helix domain-containing protein n=1 Tax=Actinoplanes sp. DH11 TaxID=2857011 RepID=UPI001E40BADE|nr:helix-turn-helix domain-containing protein [Actinoplanes sp. DH11]
MEQLYTIDDFCERAKLSPSTARRMIRDGELLAFKLRSQMRIPESAISDWLTKNRAQTVKA